MRLATRVAWITAWTIALISSPSNALAQDGCLADLNDDGVVNGTDLAIVLGGWGPCPVNTTFVGGVVKAGGVPVPGAMVTTDLGGKTVAGEGGIFLLEIELPSVIETVVLSATAEIGGVGFEGTKTVSPVDVGASNLVGLIEVSSGGCDTGFAWLPTFAGSLGLENSWPHAMATYDDGDGPAFFVAGDFTSVGGLNVNKIARWDGSAWSALGDGVGGIPRALAVFDSGQGPELYVGGSFATAGGSPALGVAKWNGTQWSAVGGGVNGSIYAMCVFDDGTGPALYAAGAFAQAGGVDTRNIAKWDGKAWTEVGGGIRAASGVAASVYALTVLDDGLNTSLIAAGSFSEAGSADTRNIARWDGGQWSELGSGIGPVPSDVVFALAALDDGSGPALFAGGSFAEAGGLPASRIARWRNGNWSDVGGGIAQGGNPEGANVVSLLTWDDGFGPDLYVAGYFNLAGGTAANNIARWDGQSWSPLGSGLAGGGLSLGAFQGSLFVGGPITSAGGLAANRLAQWGCITP